MEPEKLMKLIEDFLLKYYPSKDAPSPRKIVDLHDLVLYSPEIVDELELEPERVIEAFHLVASEMVYHEPTRVRIKGWHEFPSFVSFLRDIRSKDIDKLVTVECDISVFAPPKSSVTSIRWECTKCGNVITLLQIPKGAKDEKVVKPGYCGCGNKSAFRKMSTEYIDVQKLAVREPLELIEHNVQNPRQMGVLLKSDMCRKDMDALISAGIRIFLTAVVKLEKPEQPESDFILDAHYIHFVQEDARVKFTLEEIEKFKEFAARESNVLNKLADSFAPHIAGEINPKKALLLMIVSGDDEKNLDTKDTNQINVLLIGNPGSGKSQLGVQVKEVFPRTRYINAQTTTSVGLTAAGVKDEFLGGWTIQAGEIVLAHKGILVIDDFDGMAKEEQDSLHEAMSLKTIHKTAGNASATMKCETNVLAIANPKYKTWDEARTLIDQIEISKSMLDRFDLTYIFKSKKTYEDMEQGLMNIFDTFRKKKKAEKLDNSFLKKYLTYAKLQNPEFPDEEDVSEEYKKFFQSIFEKTKEGNTPITHRQGVSFWKIAKASAKLRLSPKVTKIDTKIAYDIMWDYMKELAFDKETSSFDIEMISGDVKAAEKNKYKQLEEAIITLTNNDTVVPEGEIISKGMDELGLTETQVNDFLGKLREKGDVYCPREGFYRRMK